MLDALTNNEVKDRSATEVEYQTINNNGSQRIYAKIGEVPARPSRISIKHAETGSGFKRRRDSVIIVNDTVVSDVDNVTPVTVTAQIKLSAPTGALLTTNQMKDVLAKIGSLCFTTGSTLVLDGTGTGSVALLTGSV